MKKERPTRTEQIVVRVTRDQRRLIAAAQRTDESFSDAVRRVLMRGVDPLLAPLPDNGQPTEPA